MPKSESSLQRFFHELRRRRVFRVAAVYVVAGWVVVQVVETVTEPLYLPAWTTTLVLVLVLLGFPFALGLAWAFDLTTQGIQRTQARADERPAARTTPGEEPGRMPEVAGARDAPSSARSWTAGRIAVVGAVVVLALAGAAMLFTGGPPDSDLMQNRVAVLPFENRTGDPALDDFGIVAAEFIADGLTAIDTVQSVSATEVRQMLAQAGDAEPLARVAQQTGAGLAVTGSYLLVGDSIQVRAQLLDPADGTSLTSIGPARSPRSDPTGALASIRQQAMGAVATRVGENSEELLANIEHPPAYEAYRTFLVGLELFTSQRYTEAIREFDRARDDDSTFWQPLVWTASAFGNLGRPALDDSVLRLIEPHRSELSAVERVSLDWHRAYLRGDLAAAYHAARQAYEHAPGSRSRYLAAMSALNTNRPEEVVALLREEPPASRMQTSWYGFHAVLAAALHMLGKHEQELDAARAARALFPDYPGPVYLEARALAGLDRPGEAEALVDEMVVLTPSPGNAAVWMRRTGDALAVQGHRDAAQRVYDRALKALQQQGPPETPAEQQARAEVLRRVGQLDEAAALAAKAHAADPDDRQAHALVGIIAAQRGDREQAERFAAELAARKDPYDRGGNTYNRACIRAQLGDLDRAVELLRQAHAEGQPIGYGIRVDPDHRPLRGYPAFEDLIRPKG